MNELKEKMTSIRYLPIEQFEVRFNEMYDNASENQKEEIIRLFKEGVDKHIKKVDTFIEETALMMKHDEMLELQLV